MYRYVLCAWENRFVRTAYIFILIGGTLTAVSGGVIGIGLLSIGSVFLLLLKFGLPTLYAYNITRASLEKYKVRRLEDIDPRFAIQLMSGGYCIECGFVLAAVHHLHEVKEARPDP